MQCHFPLIDVHSHCFHPLEDGVRICSVDYYEGLLKKFPPRLEGIYYSLGLHPWNNLQLLTNSQKQEFTTCLQKSGVIAVGEAGFDRLQGAEMSIQQENFRFAALQAEERGIPIIIHCVRAQQETLREIKELRLTVPIIIHGFNHKRSEMEQWLKAGCILSFGKALQNPESAVSKLLQQNFGYSFFLETDKSNITLNKLVQLAAGYLQKSEAEIRQLVWTTYLRTFAKWNQ